jgi:DNA-binding NarL/FixJ family response regulator
VQQETQPPLRILVVDDDALVRAGVSGILRTQPDLEVVGEHADGAGLADAIHATRPDLVLIDVRMPIVDGVEAVRRTRSEGGPVFLMMTAFDEEGRVVEALEAGAAGFILKDESPTEIVRAVRAAATGDAFLSPRSARQVTRWISDSTTADARRRAVTQLDLLTERERQIALALVDGPSDAELAERFHLSESSIKTHLSAIKTKWGARNRTQIAVTAALAGV